KYGIISAYTSFLVTDPNEMNAHGTPVGVVGRPVAWGGVRREGFFNGPRQMQLGGGGGAPAPMAAPMNGMARGSMMAAKSLSAPMRMMESEGDARDFMMDSLATRSFTGRAAVAREKSVADL